MSRNGNGQYTLPAGNPVVTGTSITSDWANTTLGDIATALTGSVAADGQTPMSGTLDMSNNKIVGLIDGTAPQDAATVRQISNPSITGGTINGAVIGNTNPKDGNFLNLTANTGGFSDGLTAPTVLPPTDSSTKVATTQFVQDAIAAVSSGVTSFNNRTGNVDLIASDVNNALGYTPYNAGTATVVTTDNVSNYTVGKTGLGASGTWGISISGNAASANTANAVDSITSNQVSTALGYVPVNPTNATLTGTPTAPTASIGTNTTQIATTAFVLANQGGGGGAVSSVNGHTGAVTLTAADVGAYAATNPSSYTTLTAVAAQGYTTQAWVQSQGYVTSSALSTYVTTNTTQTISGNKTFTTTSTTPFSGGIQAAFITNGSQSNGLLQDGSVRYGTSNSTMFYSADNQGCWNLAVNGQFNYKLSAPGTAFKAGGGSWTDLSDGRLKSDVQTLTTCLDTINALNPVSFTWKLPSRGLEQAVGFIADEVEQVIPSAVHEYEPTPTAKLANTVDNTHNEEIIALVGAGNTVKAIGWQNDMFAYLVGAIKELSAKCDAQQAQIDALLAK